MYGQPLLETESSGRNPTEFSVGLVGHPNAEYRTHEEELAWPGWPAVTPRYGEGVSSSGKCAVGALTLTRGPHPLCLGKGHGQWLEEPCLAPPPIGNLP